MLYVLVHGAMCGGWVWDHVAAQLRAADHAVRVAEQLPSGGSDPSRLGGLNEDANYVRRMLDGIDAPAVLVGHSYGGMVITELAAHPNVAHSVYLTAVWPHRGQSVNDLYGGVLPRPIIRRDDSALELTDDFEVVCDTFGRGLGRAATEIMASRFVLQSEASWTDRNTAPERRHPTTYMVATEETEVAVVAQESLSTRADHVERLPGAHMLMLNRADEVAGALARVSIG